MTSIYGPVTDWATDFDHAEPNYNANAHEVWAELRDGCPVAHTDRYNGVWLPVTHEHVAQIAYDTDHFTSRSVIVSPFVPIVEAPIGNAPPISSDPPFHHDARRLLLPAFAPKVIEPWEHDILARPEMALDSAPIDTAFDEHIYFSKEAASGGRGFGGGGCGCN